MINRRINILAVAAAVSVLLSAGRVSAVSTTEPTKRLPVLHAAVIDVGPIDIHRRYLSMQGPLAVESFTVGDLVTRQKTIVPESRIRFIENGSTASTMGSACRLSEPKTANRKKKMDLPCAALHQPRQLYWYKGVQVETIDEKGRVMPTQEFVCHVCIMVSPQEHNRLFPYGKGFSVAGCRLANVTQGQNIIMMPEGFGIPMASDEKINIGLQAANRTTDQHRRIKIRCIMYFAKDQDLDKPVQALTMQASSISVITSKTRAGESECSACVESSMGQDAPNDLNKMFMHKTPAGEMRSAHWVVTPGVHKYSEAITEDVSPGFALNGPIRAAQIHVHPYCESFSLVEYRHLHKKVLFTIHCTTKTSPGVQITHIDPINVPQGIPLHKDAQYAQEVVYNNTSGKPTDAMATSVIWFSDSSFKKPAWAQEQLSSSR